MHSRDLKATIVAAATALGLAGCAEQESAAITNEAPTAPSVEATPAVAAERNLEEAAPTPSADAVEPPGEQGPAPDPSAPTPEQEAEGRAGPVGSPSGRARPSQPMRRSPAGAPAVGGSAVGSGGGAGAGEGVGSCGASCSGDCSGEPGDEP